MWKFAQKDPRVRMFARGTCVLALCTMVREHASKVSGNFRIGEFVQSLKEHI